MENLDQARILFLRFQYIIAGDKKETPHKVRVELLRLQTQPLIQLVVKERGVQSIKL